MPTVTADGFDGLFYMEAANAAYASFNVTGSGGSGDVVFFGLSCYAPASFSVAGARLSVLGTYANSAEMVADGTCRPANATAPNGGLPQCVLPDILPSKVALSDSLALVTQAHDYIRALGEYDIAINYPELSP